MEKQKSIKETILKENEKQLNNIKLKKTDLLALSKLIINENILIDNELKIKLILTEDNDSNNVLDSLHSTNYNDNILANFCKKLKQLNKPNENNLITKRLHNEYKNKKNIQIEKLELEIDKLINSMNEIQINNYNSYTIRKHDQASKQYKAINKAIENLDNAKKIKINVS